MGHIYQAVSEGCCIAVAAHPEEFAAGERLGPLVEFSRAWLPAPARVACAARVFARDPVPFLEAGANLLAIPRDAVTQLMALRDDIVVLDSEGVRIDGQPPAFAAAEYARIACQSFRQSDSPGMAGANRHPHS